MYVGPPIGSLLLLQSLLYYDYAYTYFICIATLVLHFFKLYALPFPEGYWSIEVLVIVIYFVLSISRISYGMVGNRIESAKHIILMIFLTAFAIFCNIYFVAR